MGFAFSTTAPARSTFQGRERELAAIDAALRAGQRLVTVIGLPGVGKSRLLEEFVEDPRRSPYLEASGEGRALPALSVDLSAIADSRNLEVEIAQALGLGLEASTGLRIGSALPAQAELVVLDNVDALAPQLAPIVSGWLESCPKLRIVATSIVPLGLGDEARIELRPLDKEDACSLYLDGLQRAGILRESLPESELVEELVCQLDRLPLAIELASSIARVLPPHALLSRLSRRFDVLRAAQPGRHSSLQDTLGRAFDLLPPLELRALMRASVFAGGFSLEAAQAILQAEEEPIDLVHLLDDLRCRGLLLVENSEQPRFRLPSSVRELAAQRLQRSPFEEEALRRHMVYFAAEGELHAGELDGPRARAAVLWFGAERENLQAAHFYARAREPLIALRAGLAFASAFRIQPPLRSEIPFLDSLVHIARTLGDDDLLVRALRLVGAAQASLGLTDPAASKLKEALQLARAIGSGLEEGFTIIDLCGWILLPKREFETAGLELEQALSIARAQQSQLLEGLALMRLGVLEGMRFDYEASGKLIQEALSIFRQGGHRFQEGRSLSNLCRVYRGLGRIRQERQVMQEALEIVRETGDSVAEANYLQHQGASELVLGNLDEAETLTIRSLEVDLSQTNQSQRPRSLGILGILGLLRGEPKVAVQRLLEAITLSETAHENLTRAQLLPFFAAAAAMLGRRHEARESLDDARLALCEVGDPSADELCDLLEGVLELSEAKRLAANQQEDLAADLEASARARLAAVQHPTHGSKEFVTLAIQLLEKLLSGTAGLQRPASSLEVLVGREGAWLEPAGGKRIHLRKRTSLRRVLMALLHQRRAAPGLGLSCDELFAAAWPGEAIHPDSAKARVYTAIWTLRSFGIPIALTGKGEGYILDPKVSIKYAG